MKKRYLYDIAVILLSIIVIFILQQWVIKPYSIPSASMKNTLQCGDRIMVNRLLEHRGNNPKRGEIWVFQPPNTPGSTMLEEDNFKDYKTESAPEDTYVKRVIGLPGDKIESKGGQLYINDEELNENYLHNERDSRDWGPYKISKGKYFMLGDNRKYSADSRYLGQVDRDNFIGRASFVYWPPKNWGWADSANTPSEMSSGATC